MKAELRSIYSGPIRRALEQRGSSGPPIITGTYTGTGTPRPTAAAPGEMWLITAPVPTAAPTNPSGGAATAGDVMEWTGTAWVNLGKVMGPPGPLGPVGPNGPVGPQGLIGPPGVVQGVLAGTNVTVNASDPRFPIVAATGTGGGGGGTDVGAAWYLNKQWYALGTSITADGSYANKLALASGMILNNRGQSGGSLSTASNGNIWSALTTQVPGSAQVITLETINDFRLNVPLGAITDAENPATSYFGALRAAANWLLTNRPGARSFFITAYGDAYVGYPNGKTTNSLGKYYWEYNDAMKRVADVYGIPVIDVGRESGINFYTCPYFTTDLIHMNTLGGQRYSDYVWSRIMSLGWLNSPPTGATAPVNVPVAGVTIQQNDFALGIGTSQQLALAFSPPNATNKGVSWATSNAGVVTVTGTGQVTAVAAGTATITVTTTEGAFTDTVVVTASVVHPSSVDVQPVSIRLLPATTRQLTATVFPTNSTNKAVTWSSGAPSIATVNGSGLVTAVALGSATITATTTDGSFTDTCAVLVSSTIPATGVSLTPPTILMGRTGTQQLTATVLPSDATNTAVTYASSDPAIATVSAGGLVSGVAEGFCTITVTTADGGFTDTTTTEVGGEWLLQPQTSFRECNLNGLTWTGSDPGFTSISVGSYGALILNSPAHNAIEFTVKNGGVGGWMIYGSQIGDDTTFVGTGDMHDVGMTTRGVFVGGNVSGTAGLTPAPINAAWATGKVYRVGRSGDRIKIVRVDGGVLTTIWDGTFSANFAGHETKYGQVDLGVLQQAGPGGVYSLPINCRTGVWTPP